MRGGSDKNSLERPAWSRATFTHTTLLRILRRIEPKEVRVNLIGSRWFTVFLPASVTRLIAELD